MRAFPRAHIFLLLCTALAVMACSPAVSTPRSGGSDAGPTETPGDSEGSSSSDGSGSDGSGSADERDSGHAGGHTGSDAGHTGSDPADAGTDPQAGQDAGSGTGWTSSWTAHLMESCDSNRFAGFTLFISKERATCDEFWYADEEKVMFIVGEDALQPPSAGRTYTMVPDPTAPGGIYPADGDVTALHESDDGTFSDGMSGTVTVASTGPDTADVDYVVTLENGVRIEGTFTTEECIPVCD